jgi:hypothetical protein
MTKGFCVFIISHGRPDNVLTLQTLKKKGYAGQWFIVCDNEDETVDKYRKNYGKKSVLVFDKIAYASKVDSCDNFQNRRTTTHARNACFDFAKELGFEFFLVLDDDYYQFNFTFNRAGEYIDKVAKRLDAVFSAYCNFLESDQRITSVCMAQGGDLIGGRDSGTLKSGNFPWRNRKAMNSFFCKTSRRFWFFSRLNEDVNTYLSHGSRGALFFTLIDFHLHQKATQKTAGGMSSEYLSSGTYVKSFYTVMNCPSFVKVTMQKQMGRIHHKISWENAVPKIIDDSFKKN